MVDILETTQEYVPCIPYSSEQCLSTGRTVTVERARMHRVLVGGDQLTAARVRAAKKAKLNGETPLSRLEGVIPAVEDWHTKANFLGVSEALYDLPSNCKVSLWLNRNGNGTLVGRWVLWTTQHQVTFLAT